MIGNKIGYIDIWSTSWWIMVSSFYPILIIFGFWWNNTIVEIFEINICVVYLIIENEWRLNMIYQFNILI